MQLTATNGALTIRLPHRRDNGGGELDVLRERKMKIILIVFAIIGGIFLTPNAFAKARYADKTEMIQEAEAIVIVNITKVEEVEKKPESGWTYRQKATVEIKQSIKGELSGQVEVFGMENFICAQCKFKTGRHLLFLIKGIQGFWHGSNWHLGIRPISEDKVEWFKDDKSRFDMTQQTLSDVKTEIEEILKKKAPNKTSDGI